MSEHYVSKEKMEELKHELRELKTTHRIEIAERLKRAKEFGDLSENFEYAQAKEDQDHLEHDIFKLENLIKNSSVITKSKNKSVVSVGLTVALRKADKSTSTFTIVGSQEADPSHNKISNVSPIGKELIGRKIGDVVKVKTPKGSVVQYEIIAIE
ncbi:MAG: transcription elongation factor GreA [Patescibacteria group bacterium]|nr:transcription elongation factor GreA [Patescibacteria group bacterium]